MTVRGFRDSFRSYTPIWLQNRQDTVTGKLLNVGYRMLWSMIFPLDVATQTIVEGLKAALPGIGTPTANAVLGQSRGLLQGESESDLAFAARLIAWLSSWSEDDSLPDEQLARQIQAYLGNTPQVTVVDRAGHWLVLASNGSISTAVAPWNWDGVSNPELATMWSDLWIIVYPCEWPQAPNFETRKAMTRNQGDGIGATGGQAMRTASDAILSLVSLRKGAETRVVSIIYSYDPTLCTPGGSNNPDGNWGQWSKPSAGPTSPRVPSRSPNARYAATAHRF